MQPSARPAHGSDHDGPTSLDLAIAPCDLRMAFQRHVATALRAGILLCLAFIDVASLGQPCDVVAFLPLDIGPNKACRSAPRGSRSACASSPA